MPKYRAPRIPCFSIIRESAGNDTAASFQRAGYQGYRISPPNLAMALMAVVHAAHSKFGTMPFGRAGLGRIIPKANRPLRRWFPGIFGIRCEPGFILQPEQY
jgi:hypothetical protein